MKAPSRGFLWAVLIGLGASSMECVYCAFSFTGLSSFFTGGRVKTLMEIFSCAFIVFLGLKFLLARAVKLPTKLGAASERLEARLEQRLHPHSGYMTGLVRVMGNLGVLIFWIFLAAYLLSHEWVYDSLPAKAACVAGVALGTNTWFFALSFAVSRGYGRLSEASLVRMQHLSGVVLITFGARATGLGTGRLQIYRAPLISKTPYAQSWNRRSAQRRQIHPLQRPHP